MSIKKNYIAIVDTVYAIFLYSLIFTEQLDETFFFVSDGININIRENLSCMYIKKRDLHEYNIRVKLSNFIYNLILGIRIKLKLIFLGLKVNRVYGQDHIPIARYFLPRFDFFLLEDGVANYSVKQKIFPNDHSGVKALRRIFKMRQFNIFGLDDQVKRIYLTGLAPIPEDIKNKVELISVSSLWEKKSINEKQKIMSIFNIDFDLIDEVKSYSYLLLTQPLSEDGIISEYEKIELYKKITKNIPKERLLVKTHPRETTDYQEIFKDSMVLSMSFPSQLLSLNSIKFSTVLTLFSSGIMEFISDDTIVQFYGTSIHPILLNHFGNISWDEEKKKILCIDSR